MIMLPSQQHPPCRLSSTLTLLVLLCLTGFSKDRQVQAASPEAAASTSPSIFQRILELFFTCGVIPAEGCGLFGLAAVVRATPDPNDPGCVEKCSYFPGILAPDYFCGSCAGDGFEMTLDLHISSQYRAYFTNSAARWERVIVGDLPDWTVSNPPQLPDDRCNYPATIDDLYICVFDGYIDGPGSTAGYAGVLRLRDTGDPLPVVAYAQFEEEDIPGAIQVGWFQNLVIHEFGHALGIGTQWSCPSSSFGNSPRANQEYRDISGCSNLVKTEGNAFGSSGNQCIHWKKNNCFQGEIMTNIVWPTSKLSSVTIGALDDMGYSVDYNAADNFGRSDLGSDCVCRNRQVRQLTALSDQSETTTTTTTRAGRQRQLSEAGLQDATAKGRAFLQTMQAPAGVSGAVGEPEYEYVGDKFVYVIYIEGGDAYSVYVEP